MHMSVNEAPEMHDIPLSADEPSTTVRSSMKTKYNSLRGLFKLPNKKKPKADEVFAVGEPPQLKDGDIKSESLLAGCHKKEQHNDTVRDKYEDDLANTTSTHKPLKQSLKKSISTYWNSVFKRSQPSAGSVNNANLDDKLSDTDEYARKNLSEEGEPMSRILEAVGQLDEEGACRDQARNSVDLDVAKMANDCVESESQVASCSKIEQLVGADVSSRRAHVPDENPASTSAAYKSSKKTIKKSISANWNSIFKRHQYSPSNEASSDLNKPPGENGDGHDESEMRHQAASFKTKQTDLDRKREEEYDGDDENEFCHQPATFKDHQIVLEKQPDDEYDGDDEKDLNDERELKSTNLQSAEDEDNSVNESV